MKEVRDFEQRNTVRAVLGRDWLSFEMQMIRGQQSLGELEIKGWGSPGGWGLHEENSETVPLKGMDVSSGNTQLEVARSHLKGNVH